MTSTDKTREQLMSSIRKSKDTAREKDTTASRPAPKKKQSGTPRAGRKSPKESAAAARKPAAGSTATARPQTDVDPYQGAPRIWPD